MRGMILLFATALTITLAIMAMLGEVPQPTWHWAPSPIASLQTGHQDGQEA
jgi:hypothetical protein